MMDDFKCKIKVRPVEEWLNDEEGCPPCLVTPLTSYYLGALQKAGETMLAKELEKIYEKGDALTICKKLDKIKNDVGEALSKELRDLDCFAQMYHPEALSK